MTTQRRRGNTPDESSSVRIAVALAVLGGVVAVGIVSAALIGSSRPPLPAAPPPVARPDAGEILSPVEMTAGKPKTVFAGYQVIVEARNTSPGVVYRIVPGSPVTLEDEHGNSWRTTMAECPDDYFVPPGEVRGTPLIFPTPPVTSKKLTLRIPATAVRTSAGEATGKGWLVSVTR